jgi:hypothetical protein
MPRATGSTTLEELPPRWALSVATVGAVSGTVRRERAVFGSLTSSAPFTRPSLLETPSGSLPRSTSAQRKASASLRRSPVHTRSRKSTPYRSSSPQYAEQPLQLLGSERLSFSSARLAGEPSRQRCSRRAHHVRRHRVRLSRSYGSGERSKATSSPWSASTSPSTSLGRIRSSCIRTRLARFDLASCRAT